jgi:hypothetical protein
MEVNARLVCILGLTGVMVASVAASAETMRGRAVCNKRNASECTVALLPRPNSISHYWIDQFNPNGDAWQPVVGPVPNPGGQSLATGFLYRVVGCAEGKRTEACVTSPAFWAQVRPESAEQIPDVVNSIDGPMTVSRRLSLDGQIAQYNVYLVTELTENIEEMQMMPAMNEPLIDPFAAWDSDKAMMEALFAESPTFEDLLHFQVYGVYEGARRLSSEAALRSSTN